jgi:uncharacterized protein (DUF1330 family)
MEEEMAAYIIVDVNVKDAKAFEPYKQPTSASVAQYGGRFIVRSSEYEVLEGDWRPTRLVIIEFPSLEAAKRWYESPEYRKVLPIRLQHAVSKMLLVNGV